MLVGASHGRRVVLVSQSIGTPHSIQGVVEEAVNQFDMTIVDSEDWVASNVSFPVQVPPPTALVCQICMHTDSRSVGGSSDDETVAVDGWEESLAGNDDDIPVFEDIVEVVMARTAGFSDGLASLDVIDPRTVFECRALVLRSVPRFLHGPFRNVLKIALEECLSPEILRQERGWKLLMLVPKMLLHRPPGGGLIPKSRLVQRFEVFSRGEFSSLFTLSEVCDTKAAISCHRHRRALHTAEIRDSNMVL